MKDTHLEDELRLLDLVDCRWTSAAMNEFNYKIRHRAAMTDCTPAMPIAERAQRIRQANADRRTELLAMKVDNQIRVRKLEQLRKEMHNG